MPGDRAPGDGLPFPECGQFPPPTAPVVAVCNGLGGLCALVTRASLTLIVRRAPSSSAPRRSSPATVTFPPSLTSPTAATIVAIPRSRGASDGGASVSEFVLVGFESGHVRAYDAAASEVWAQRFHTSRVLSVRARASAASIARKGPHARHLSNTVDTSGGGGAGGGKCRGAPGDEDSDDDGDDALFAPGEDTSEDVAVCHAGGVVARVDGAAMIAVLRSSGAGGLDAAGKLPFRKWRLEGGGAADGSDPPAARGSLLSASGAPPSSGSAATAPGSAPSSSPEAGPSDVLLCGLERTPLFQLSPVQHGVHHAFAVGEAPFLSTHTLAEDDDDVSSSTAAIAGKLTSAVISWGMSFLSGESADAGAGSGAGPGPGAGDPDGGEDDVPCTDATRTRALRDTRPAASPGSLCPEPTHRLALLPDPLGRVHLVDTTAPTVPVIFKGFRDARCGWLRDGQTVAIHAARRGIMELWSIRGERLGGWGVGQGWVLGQGGVALGGAAGGGGAAAVLMSVRTGVVREIVRAPAARRVAASAASASPSDDHPSDPRRGVTPRAAAAAAPPCEQGDAKPRDGREPGDAADIADDPALASIVASLRDADAAARKDALAALAADQSGSEVRAAIEAARAAATAGELEIVRDALTKLWFTAPPPSAADAARRLRAVCNATRCRVAEAIAVAISGRLPEAATVLEPELRRMAGAAAEAASAVRAALLAQSEYYADASTWVPDDFAITVPGTGTFARALSLRSPPARAGASADPAVSADDLSDRADGADGADGATLGGGPPPRAGLVACAQFLFHPLALGGKAADSCVDDSLARVPTATQDKLFMVFLATSEPKILARTPAASSRVTAWIAERMLRSTGGGGRAAADGDRDGTSGDGVGDAAGELESSDASFDLAMYRFLRDDAPADIAAIVFALAHAASRVASESGALASGAGEAANPGSGGSGGSGGAASGAADESHGGDGPDRASVPSGGDGDFDDGLTEVTEADWSLLKVHLTSAFSLSSAVESAPEAALGLLVPGGSGVPTATVKTLTRPANGASTLTGLLTLAEVAVALDGDPAAVLAAEEVALAVNGGARAPPPADTAAAAVPAQLTQALRAMRPSLTRRDLAAARFRYWLCPAARRALRAPDAEATASVLSCAASDFTGGPARDRGLKAAYLWTGVAVPVLARLIPLLDKVGKCAKPRLVSRDVGVDIDGADAVAELMCAVLRAGAMADTADGDRGPPDGGDAGPDSSSGGGSADAGVGVAGGHPGASGLPWFPTTAAGSGSRAAAEGGAPISLSADANLPGALGCVSVAAANTIVRVVRAILRDPDLRLRGATIRDALPRAAAAIAASRPIVEYDRRDASMRRLGSLDLARQSTGAGSSDESAGIDSDSEEYEHGASGAREEAGAAPPQEKSAAATGNLRTVRFQRAPPRTARAPRKPRGGGGGGGGGGGETDGVDPRSLPEVNPEAMTHLLVRVCSRMSPADTLRLVDTVPLPHAGAHTTDAVIVPLLTTAEGTAGAGVPGARGGRIDGLSPRDARNLADACASRVRDRPAAGMALAAAAGVEMHAVVTALAAQHPELMAVVPPSVVRWSADSASRGGTGHTGDVHAAIGATRSLGQRAALWLKEGCEDAVNVSAALETLAGVEREMSG